MSIPLRCSLIFGGIIVFVFSCTQQAGIPPERGSLIRNADPERVYRSWSAWKRAMSDSGTLSGHYLNLPDTVFQVLRDQKGLEAFYKKYLAGDGPSRLNRWFSRITEHGLDPAFYHEKFLKTCSRRIDAGAWTEKDRIPYDSFSLFLLLSADAMCAMHQDLGTGRVEPAYSKSTYTHPRRRVTGTALLLSNGDPWRYLDSAEPAWADYSLLRREYKRLSAFPDSLEGKDIYLTKSIRPGDAPAPDILSSLAKKLRMRGYLKMHDTSIRNLRRYNDTLVQTVKLFQEDHGMKPDGVVGPATAAKLNQHRKSLMEALAGSMERHRWLGPVNSGARIWVNIASNMLEAWRNDSLKLSMKTCSGEPRGPKYYEKLKASNKPGSRVLPPDNLETPNFKARISHFVVNPTWYVPRNIVIKEMLPEIRKNPAILSKMGYVIKNRNGDEIDPGSINWWAISPGRVNFTIEQTTGADNSLGLVVVHFPNAYSIFMHDTPHKWVFDLEERHVSHGCIRLEKPFELVEFLTTFNKKDNFDKALMTAGLPPKHDTALLREWKKAEQERLDTGGVFKPVQDKYFRLDSALPVYIVYFTACSSASGRVVFWKDAYHRDNLMMKEMKRPGRRRRHYKS